MQIIEPGMHPFYGAIIFLLLFGIAFPSISLIAIGLRRYSRHRKHWPFLIPGLCGIIFILLNWIGYNHHYNELESPVIGKFVSQTTEATLQVNEDHTWTLTGYEACSGGKWEYILSEDWCFWRFTCEKYAAQSTNPDQITFNGLNDVFNKTEQRGD